MMVNGEVITESAAKSLIERGAKAERARLRPKILRAIRMNTYGRKVGTTVVVDRDDLMNDIDIILPEEAP